MTYLSSILCLVLAASSGFAGDLVATNDLEAMVLDAARLQVAAPDRFDAESVRFVPAIPAERRFVRANLKLLSVKGPNRAGIVRVEVRDESAGAPAQEYRATVRGRVMGPALVAGQTLLHKAAIDPGRVKVEEANLTRLSEPPLRSADQLADLVPSRTLSSGRVLTAGLMQPEPLVRQGEPVELLYQSGGVRVTLLAIALQDAAAGDTASARVAKSGARVSGVLGPDGRLKVRHRIR